LFPYNLSVAHALQRAQMVRVTKKGYKLEYCDRKLADKSLIVSSKGN
jgi:hypothetical protein